MSDLRKAVLTLMQFSKGGMSFDTIMEMPADDFHEWVKDAVDLQTAVNKAARK